MADEHTDFIELIDRLDADIAELRQRSLQQGEDRTQELASIEKERDRLIELLFGHLSPWDQVRLARHPRRPYTLDYLNSAFDDFVELHGDRRFGDDPAMVGGFGWIGGYPVVTFGQQKGRDIKERALRNFGSARPEGYRKALRLMQLADKLSKPIVAIIDTPAADCSVEAEERGISEALAYNLMEMFRIRAPIVVAVVGEGGSGGALGIGVGDRVLMMQHAIYSVIPPEGCAAILWRAPDRKVDAAEALRLTAQGALDLGLIDSIIEEPFGGAHRDPEAASQALRRALIDALDEIASVNLDELLELRYQKFRAMGQWTENVAAEATASG
ncbi:MAG: acetyl-CoA carboxylase carboxyltransferase subunit alpha [Armatimonadetes bacterium]|nr:acetyl-CoA carboxylase carboxyltransferase subunit alpha [Armatimonadota bacterium]